MDDNTNLNNQDQILNDTTSPPPVPMLSADPSTEPSSPADSTLPQDNNQDQEDRYKKILEEYTQKVDTTEPVSDSSEPKLPHQVPDENITTTPTVSTPVQTDTTKDAPEIKNPSRFNLFKYLFYISTVIFIVILGLLIKDYLKLQQLTKNLDKTTPTNININTNPETPTPSVDVSSVCTINDVEYTIGESFPAEDGCNTCECQKTDSGPQIICTLIDCADGPNESDDITK